MNHWIIAPIVLPAFVAPFIIMVLRHHLDLQRIFSLASTVALNAIALVLMSQALTGEIGVYELGDWQAPFGIVLVLDRLSAMMVLLTTFLALAIQLYVIGSGWDRRGQHFHALFQFLLMGVLGAFLTNDAFNLFVFFEVLLIASYGLMIHGGGGKRLSAGVQYVVYNLLGSTLFLFALGTLYSVTGTLNMTDLAVRVAELPAQDTALLRVGAVMLLLVFAIKSAVLPLHFWLPGSYANAPLPVAAFFAIMTKVGAYAILRVYTLVFGPDLEVTQGLIDTWLLPAALLTLAVGAIGVLGSREVGRLVAFAALTSMGTLLVSIAMFTPLSTTAALYYIVHSTFAAAMAFLIADLIMERRGADIEPHRPMPQSGLIASLFFVAAIAMAGMPPLSGFIGKILVMEAAQTTDQIWLIWAVILVSSLITIVGFARAGAILFWKSHDPDFVREPEATIEPRDPNHDYDGIPFGGNGDPDVIIDDDAPVEADPNEPAPEPRPALAITAVFVLLVGLITLTILGGPVLAYAEATAQQLFSPSLYIETVLERP
jgi:multicomponent K+:H+ antiporter subunit D